MTTYMVRTQVTAPLLSFLAPSCGSPKYGESRKKGKIKKVLSPDEEFQTARKQAPGTNRFRLEVARRRTATLPCIISFTRSTRLTRFPICRTAIVVFTNKAALRRKWPMRSRNHRAKAEVAKLEQMENRQKDSGRNRGTTKERLGKHEALAWRREEKAALRQAVHKALDDHETNLLFCGREITDTEQFSASTPKTTSLEKMIGDLPLDATLERDSHLKQTCP